MENSVVAVYQTHRDADRALEELRCGGIDMQKLSIFGKGNRSTGDRMKCWGKVGMFWGGLCSLLFGSALFMTPGLGPILVAGPLVAWIVTGLEGAVAAGALSVLGAGLYSMVVHKNRIVKYEEPLKTSQFLLIARGTDAEVDKAKHIIESTHPVLCTRRPAYTEFGTRLGRN